MNPKMFIKFSLIFLLLALPRAHAQTTIFPQTYSDNDAVFLQASYPGFVSFAGYFTQNTGALQINIVKQAILLDPLISTCYQNDGTTPADYDDTNTSATTLAVTTTSFSELENVWKHTVQVSSDMVVKCIIPLYYVTNINYTFQLKIPIMNFGNPDDQIVISLYDGAAFQDIFNKPAYVLAQNTIDLFIFTITMSTKVAGLTYTIQCNKDAGKLIDVLVDKTNKLTLSFAFQTATSSPTLSWYSIGLTTGTALTMTRDGTPSCNATTNPCIEGYTCDGATCKQCHASCLTCTKDSSYPNSNSACTFCQRHTYVSTPASGWCPFQYVDISQYTDISVTAIDPPRTNRVTLGFWTFIADLSLMNGSTKNVVHATMRNFLTITLTAQSNTNVAAYCSVFQKYKTTWDTSVDPAGLTVEINKDSTTVVSNTVSSVNAKWFYSQCAMSFEDRLFYLNNVVNNVDSYTPKTLRNEILYKDSTSTIYSDVFFRTIYRKGDKLIIDIKNAQNAKSKLYIRNLVAFREFIPYNVKYYYYNLHNIITAPDEYPELIFALPFDNLSYGATYSTNSYTFGTSKATLTVTLTPSSTPNLYPPINFKRLETHNTKNYYFGSMDLAPGNIGTLTSINAGDNFLFNTNQSFSCSDYFWLFLTDYHCDADCPAGTTMYPGVGTNKGYCNYTCDGGTNCPTTNGQLKDYINQFTCKAGYQNIFYQCAVVPDPNGFALYYSSFYPNANIVLDFTTEPKILRSYFIEIWYFPDLSMLKSNFALSGTDIRNYIFYSNTMRLYMHKSVNANYIETDYQTAVVDVTAKMNTYEWNKLIFNVVYDDTTKIYTVEFYTKNTVSTKVTLSSATTPAFSITTPTDESLKYILFCHSDSMSCAGNTIYWASGFYKGLRIWDGDKAQPFSTAFFDSFSGSYITMRTDAVLLSYPLTEGYFKGNKLNDPMGTRYYYTALTWNPWDLQNWNYCSQFDYIATKGISSKYLTAVTVGTSVSLGNCNASCTRCFGTTNADCYACSTNYFLLESTCILKTSGRYYFSAPALNANVAIPVQMKTFNGVSPAGTITFWIKVIGFKLYPGVMISYSDNLELIYDSTQGTTYGLQLVYHPTASTSTTLAINSTFRQNFGQWTFISLAFYDFNYSGYFPAMMKFEINQTPIPVVSIPNGILICNFKLSDQVFALFSSLKVYSIYIVGAYGYETNTVIPPGTIGRPIPIGNTIYFPPSTTATGCFDTSTANAFSGTVICQLDYNDQELNPCTSSTTTYQYLNYKSGTRCNTCPTGCKNACYASNINAAGRPTTCSCVINNDHTQMLLSNGNANMCKQYDYINFSKADTLILSGAGTAKDTKRYTMQFWMFAYSYVAYQFKGVTFTWQYHNKIQISLTGITYSFKCYPDAAAATYDSVVITINKWNYISCGVDYSLAKFFMTTDSTTPKIQIFTPGTMTTLTSATLTISDDATTNEWGVLFYRQIRLWRDCAQTAGFLSWLYVVTPSLFPDLLNLWDPINYGTNDIDDLAGTVVTQTLAFSNPNLIGTNVLDDTTYSLLSLCSENGEYYDTTMKKCMQFTDLSKMNDIIFPSVPASYTGNYSMEFWIFAEDYTYITGVHVQWEKHVQVTVIFNTAFTAMCFPQGYYADSLSNSNVSLKYSKATNKASTLLPPTSGTWIWVRCSVSNYNQSFFVTSSNELTTDIKINPLLPEILYNSTPNDYPFRYFFSNKTSTQNVANLNLLNVKNTKKVYFRYIYLFKDYIPGEYDFRYMDLTKMKANEFPSLVFACNFADYVVATKKLTYSTYLPSNKSSPTVTLSTTATSMELSTNFLFFPLCDPSLKQKYDPPNNVCATISVCVINTLNALYCSGESTPLVCDTNNYMNLTGGNMTCDGKCPVGYIRTPGSVANQAICNSPCPTSSIDTCPDSSTGLLTTFPDSFACKPEYNRINYSCSPLDNAKTSALFFSRCYNFPNIYVSFSASTQAKLASGYILEFWFKIDSIYNTCTRVYTQDYYLFAPPHSIYYVPAENKYYYNIIGSTVYKKELPAIKQYEWNIILIKTVLKTNSSDVYVFVNYDFSNPAISYLAIDTSTQMPMQALSFCSTAANGNCSPNGTENINWGSAYYKNFRLWDLSSSTEYVVQAFTGGMFTETPKSLVIYYTMAIDKVDVNQITNKIGSYDHIVYSSYSTAPFYSADNYLFYNYSSAFDWGASNYGKFINSINTSTFAITSGTCAAPCKRCYSEAVTTCYECQSGYVLRERTCQQITNYYLKIPVGTANTEVSLKTNNYVDYDLTKLVSFTLTFWMKFFGVVSTSFSALPPIISLSANTYLAFDVANKNLNFVQNNKNAFVDTSFQSSIGNWVPVTISNYISNSNNYLYPNMLTFSVNRVDIPFYSGYTIPTSGVAVTQLTLGYEVVALFAEMRIYSTFMQGSYGHFMATSTTKASNLLFILNLSGNAATNCLTDDDLASGLAADLKASCIGDYHPYLDTAIQCDDDKKYFDPYITTQTPPCGDCDATCTTKCFYSTTSDCTCDMTQGIFWLRRRPVYPTKAYCERIKYVDFSTLNAITINTINSSTTLESSLEMWVFVYSYNPLVNNFYELDVEWSLHNRIQIVNSNNSLSIKCYPLVDSSNPVRWTENTPMSSTFYKWNLVRCGTDLVFKKYFFNSVLSDLQTTDLPTRDVKTSLKIYSPAAAKNNFGYVFLRDIKLWQQFNYKYIDSSYIALTSLTKYPGLLSYFKNEFNGTLAIEDMISGNYTVISRRIDFVGYNFIDPTNVGLYNTLTLCDEGKIWNSATLNCIKPAVTKCEIPGDISDNCLTCDSTQIYINTDGTCVSTCLPTYFEHTKINQCRPCDTTCYKCTGIYPNNCTACTGELYFNFLSNTCIPNCEEVGLTKSITTPNICVIFDASAVLVNVDTVTPIDPNTFTEITAKVVNATAPGYTTLWDFNATETMIANNHSELLKLNASGPFNGDKTNLTTSLDPSFFQLGFKYNFILNIVKTNMDSSIVILRNWTVIMNKAPWNGQVVVMPPLGLRNTTTFILKCLNWTDDNTQDLQYRFYSQESNTNIKNYLMNWTSATEMYTNFTVRYYQQTTSKITIYCDAKDKFNATATAQTDITIVNSLSSGIYNLTMAMSNYELPTVVTDDNLIARSEFLKSLGIDTYKEVRPKFYQSEIIPSLDGSIMTITDPTCTPGFCNSNGDCELVDVFIACNCQMGFIGNNCHMDKTGYPKVASAYQDLFTAIMAVLESKISDKQFQSIWNLFFAASTFYQDPKFFSTNLFTFLSLAKSSFTDSIMKSTSQYLDFFEFYYSYELMRMNQYRALNKNSTSFRFRNVSLTTAQQQEFKTAFQDISDNLESFIKYVINQYRTTEQTMIYSGNNLYIAFSLLNTNFNEKAFFSDRISKYKSWVSFMKCLNLVEIERLNNPFYQAWFVFIEYQSFPFGYDSTILVNNTSPYMSLFFVDATTGKDIIVEGCTDQQPITWYQPFSSYVWMEALNAQKWLYDPNNYKSPTDPIFSDPIYINETGFVSNDTIDTRIEKYHRKYNFSCTYYNKALNVFNTTGINYTNFTSDTNYISFNTAHLTGFTSFFVQNDIMYSVDGRFFYIKHPSLFAYGPNYFTNNAFFTICAIMGFYFLSIFILTCYDMKFFRQESLLEFLKREIVKVHLPYSQKMDIDINDIVPAGFNPATGQNDNFQAYLKRRKTNIVVDNYGLDDADEHKGDVLNLNKPEEKPDIGEEINHTNEEDKEVKIEFDIDEEKKDKADSIEDIDIKNNENGTANAPQSHFFEKDTGGNSKAINPFIHDGDQGTQVFKYGENFNAQDAKPAIDVNQLPEDFENDEEEYQTRLEAFASLNLSTCQFMCWNLKQRHVMINPLINISVFNPRWKKLTMFVTECCIIMLLQSVQMTNDPNIYIDLTGSTQGSMGGLIQCIFIAVFGSNFMMYILACFFRVSSYQRRRLFKLVTSGGQLIVLKEWEEMVCNNTVYTVIGMILHIIFWCGAFYFSLGFIAVWKKFALTWVIAFCASMFLDLFLLELLVEFIVALFYACRKKGSCGRNFGEWLNRLRSYRTLWP